MEHSVLQCFSRVFHMHFIVATSLILAVSYAEENVEQLDDNGLATSDQCKGDNAFVLDGCYPKLECFPNVSPWKTLTRPVPKPDDPSEIDVGLVLYTLRNIENGTELILCPQLNVEETDFSPTKPTFLVVHGLGGNNLTGYLHEIKDSLLQNVDANVIVVSYSSGSFLKYLQVVSNLRIVAAVLARAVKQLIDLGLRPKNIHAIGHSLGAHVCAYLGKIISSDNHKIGVMTALDPAQPAFEAEDAAVKLTENDADTVIVIHTNGKPFFPFLGFGYVNPGGTIDIFVNGGKNQPDCKPSINPSEKRVTSMAALATMSVGTELTVMNLILTHHLKSLSRVVFDHHDLFTGLIDMAAIGCSHGKSVKYYVSALENKDYLCVARKISNFKTFANEVNLRTLARIDDQIISRENLICTKEDCSILGLLTSVLPARGNFDLETLPEYPYCKTKASEVPFLL